MQLRLQRIVIRPSTAFVVPIPISFYKFLIVVVLLQSLSIRNSQIP